MPPWRSPCASHTILTSRRSPPTWSRSSTLLFADAPGKNPARRTTSAYGISGTPGARWTAQPATTYGAPPTVWVFVIATPAAAAFCRTGGTRSWVRRWRPCMFRRSRGAGAGWRLDIYPGPGSAPCPSGGRRSASPSGTPGGGCTTSRTARAPLAAPPPTPSTTTITLALSAACCAFPATSGRAPADGARRRAHILEGHASSPIGTIRRPHRCAGCTGSRPYQRHDKKHRSFSGAPSGLRARPSRAAPVSTLFEAAAALLARGPGRAHPSGRCGQVSRC